jgi:hypothetical protein
MAKDSSLKVFVVGEVLRASHLNQMTENVGAVGYLAPYNSQLSRDSAGVVFLGTTDAALGGIVLKAGYKFLESDGINTTDITLGGGSSSALASVELKSQLDKLGVNTYVITEKYYLNENFTDSNFQMVMSGSNVTTLGQISGKVVRLGKSYGTGDLTSIYLHNNYQSISKANALSDGTGVWTSLGAQAGAAVVGGTTSIEGGAAIYTTVSATTGENGLRFILNGSSQISSYNSKFRFALNLNTISNISTIKAIVADTTGTANSASWNLTSQASGSALIAGWNFMEIPLQGTASATSGSLNYNGINQVHIKITPTSSQAFVMAVDDLCSVSSYELDLPTSLQIRDGSNTQLINIDSGANGAYQLGTNVLNSYTIENAVLARRNAVIDNGVSYFPSGTSALSGLAAKQLWDITHKNFSTSFTSKTLHISEKFDTPEFKIIDAPSSTSLKLRTKNGTGDYLNFIAGDQIIIYQKKWNGRQFDSDTNATFGKNFKILTLSGSTTVSGTEITLNHTESNSGVNPNGNYFAINYLCPLHYWVGNNSAKEQLTSITPTEFTPAGLVDNKDYAKIIFQDDFTRSDGNPKNNWTATADGAGTTPAIASNKLTLSIGLGAGTAFVVRNTENYSLSNLKQKMDFYLQYSTTGPWDSNRQAIIVGTVSTNNYPTGGGTTGIALVWMNTDIIWIYEGNNIVAQAKGIFLGNLRDFNVRFQVWATGCRGKIWLSTNDEPITWNIFYEKNSPLSISNDYLQLNSRGDDGTDTMTLKKIVVSKIYQGHVVKASASNLTGSKLVTASKLTRQDTTNQDPILLQRDAVIV